MNMDEFRISGIVKGHGRVAEAGEFVAPKDRAELEKGMVGTLEIGRGINQRVVKIIHAQSMGNAHEFKLDGYDENGQQFKARFEVD